MLLGLEQEINIQNNPGTSCRAKKYESAQEKARTKPPHFYVKGTQELTERALNGQRWEKFEQQNLESSIG